MSKEQSPKGQSKVVVILLVVIILLVMVFAGVMLYLFMNKTEEQPETTSNGIAVESNLILDDPKTLQDAVDDMYKKAEEGYMTLEMKVDAYSTDGQNFTCFLANADGNSYDMYMVLYLDDTQEEIYRSGMIPIGARIETFTTNKKIEPGTYMCTLVYNQLEEDGETLHAKVNVGLTLNITN
ncbi:hypothetical protein LJC58_07220 [Lachnospiraceae bacterium OttesenSCG-928-D06]|nr:hypothetical protein [Lachnospiraceae bacterium OttesenSCG-928-D06]